MQKFVFLFFIILSGQFKTADAKENIVLTIKSDVEPKINQLSIISNQEGKVEKILLKEILSNTVQVFDICDLQKGIVLEKQSGQDVAILKSVDFTPDRGGQLAIDYLHNGISGNRRFVLIEGRYTQSGMEVAYNGVTVTKANVLGNYVFGKVVGIKEIRFYEN